MLLKRRLLINKRRFLFIVRLFFICCIGVDYACVFFEKQS